MANQLVYKVVGQTTGKIYALGNSKKQCMMVLVKKHPEFRYNPRLLGEPIKMEVSK